MLVRVRPGAPTKSIVLAKHNFVERGAEFRGTAMEPRTLFSLLHDPFAHPCYDVSWTGACLDQLGSCVVLGDDPESARGPENAHGRRWQGAQGSTACAFMISAIPALDCRSSASCWGIGRRQRRKGTPTLTTIPFAVHRR